MEKFLFGSLDISAAKKFIKIISAEAQMVKVFSSVVEAALLASGLAVRVICS